MNASASESDGRVLVTGGAGYIGSHVVRMLLARGTQVRVLDNLLYGGAGLASLPSSSNMEIVRGDIRSTSDLYRAVRGVKAVIALAALVGDQLCAADPSETIAVNLKSTGLLANAASRAGVRRVVFASSCSVYGASGHDFVDEYTTPAPVSLYAETRLLSEDMLFNCYQEIGPVALRLSTVFGLSPRMRFDLVANTMTARAVSEGKILVCNADHWRPFVHAHDAARAFIRALDAPGHQVNGQRFNVGANDLNCTIGDLATVVARRVPGATIVKSVQNGDQRSYRVRFDHIREVLSYEPHRTLEEGIAEVASALTSGTIADHRHPIYDNARYRDAARQPTGTNGGGF